MNERHACRSEDRSIPAIRARPQHRGGDRARCSLAAAGRPLGVRARGRRHHPGRIRAAAALSRPSRSMPRWKRKIAVYLRRIQGEHGGWPLFHDGAFDMSASVKAYFALKMIGDSVDAPHMRARARRSARAAAPRAQRVHPADAGALRLHPVARRAGDAGRDHAAAEVVSVPSRQDLVLEPHRHRAAAGAAGAQAAGAQSQGRRDRRAVPRAAADDRSRAQGAAAEGVVVLVLPRVDAVLRALEPLFPKRLAAARDRPRGGVGQRAAQRRGRPRRDLPGDGEQRDDVRRARLSGRSSAARDRPPVDREAAGRARARGLLPALRLADLGHRARLPRAAGGRRRARAGARPAEGSTGWSRSRSSTSKATGPRGGPMCGPAAGRSSTPTRTIPMSTTPRWW